MADEDELAEARRQGEVAGARRYLREAVTTRLAAASGRTVEQIGDAMAFMDPDSFTDDEGAIDDVKVQRFAGTLGGERDVAPLPPHDPVRAMLDHMGGSGGRSVSGSIEDIRQQTLDEYAERQSNHQRRN
jgi:class 3 adenylate cyclase